MKIRDRILITIYFPAKSLRLHLKLFYLRFKLRNLFIYRCQHFCITQLSLFNMINQKWSLYRLLALQAALKQLYSLFNYGETSNSRAFLRVAKILWFFLHKVCWLCGVTPKSPFNPLRGKI